MQHSILQALQSGEIATFEMLSAACKGLPGSNVVLGLKLKAALSSYADACAYETDWKTHNDAPFPREEVLRRLDIRRQHLGERKDQILNLLAASTDPQMPERIRKAESGESIPKSSSMRVADIAARSQLQQLQSTLEELNAVNQQDAHLQTPEGWADFSLRQAQQAERGMAEASEIKREKRAEIAKLLGQALLSDSEILTQAITQAIENGTLTKDNCRQL